MRVNSKLTWGLAWTGLAVVLAVPSADFLTGKLGGGNTTALITSTTDPVTPAKPAAIAPTPVQKTASLTTVTATKTGVTIIPVPAKPDASSSSVDPVGTYVQTGKALPNYISDGTTKPAETTQVAIAEPVAPVVAPIPFPERPADVVRPVLPKPTGPVVATDPIVTASIQTTVPKPTTPDPVVIIDQPPAPPVQEAVIAPVPDHPVPPADITDDSANWRVKGLSRYLARNGLLSSDTQSTASVTVTRPRDYDPNGFYLNDGPNSDRAQRRARVEQLLNQDDNADYGNDDGSFNLF